MEIHEVATEIRKIKKNIILIYAFNSTGKTRLSVEYKNITKDAETGRHAGVYYNAFSEDLFLWDNGDGNKDHEIRLMIRESNLNGYHGMITEDDVRAKLARYTPQYDFYFNVDHKNPENGIMYITFFNQGDDSAAIKISRGEERMFVWCFFLALFEVEDFGAQQNAHIFIDDPVSSLDDHNIFITALSIFELFEAHFKRRKIIVTTHHFGLMSILADFIQKGERKDRYKDISQLWILSKKKGTLSLENPRNDVLLYHLHLLQTLETAVSEGLYTYHFALLRQVLENIASFFGSGQWSELLQRIEVEDWERITDLINGYSHQRVFKFQPEFMNPDNQRDFLVVLEKLQKKYKFKLHTPAKS